MVTEQQRYIRKFTLTALINAFADSKNAQTLIQSPSLPQL